MIDPTTPTPAPVPADEISFGLASKLTAVIGALFAAVTAIDYVIDGNLTADAVTTMVLSVVSFLVLAGGRYAQAAMKALAKHLS